MGPLRPIFIGLAVVVSFAVIFIAYMDNYYAFLPGMSSFLPYAANMKEPLVNGYAVDTPGCRIPQWDPFDPTVKMFYRQLSVPYKCSGKPPFVYVTDSNTLFVDDRVLNARYGTTSRKILCSYQAILRDPGPEKKPTDDKYRLGRVKTLHSNLVQLEDEFAVVRCHSGGRLFSEDFVFTIPRKEETEKRCTKALENRTKNRRTNSSLTPRLNVMLVGIDSISKLNFIRHFPRTLKFLRNHLKAIELNGYTKVGDNTFPNLVPLLTGHFIDYYWNETIKNRFFDELDFLWKTYAREGYRTLFAEDDPGIATFNYLKKGFKRPPADYYFRPFALAIERSYMKARSKRDCFKNKMEIEMVFDYAKKFAEMMGKDPFFAFAFVTRLTHDVLNAAAYADIPSVSLLKQLHTRGILNNTLLVFFSDHGIRFGEIRKTYIGKFEERMPFMFLVVPEWFKRAYPNATRNLRTNERRLTTPFDIHATLVHLLDFSDDDVEIGNLSHRGISLLQEIPTERTCSDAEIFTHWCPCQTRKPVAVSDANVVTASHVLVQTVNNWLSPFSKSCAELTVLSILSAHAGEPNDDVLRFVRNVNDVINRHVQYGQRVNAPVDYLLTVEVAPSGAVFEGTLRYDQESFRVLGDISRINKYGNQSECIDDARMRKFCYCKDAGENS